MNNNLALNQLEFTSSGLGIRQEKQADYDEVYKLVDSAFATTTHYDRTEADYLNAIRSKQVFIPELSLVAELTSGKIVGQIVLYKTWIKAKNELLETLVLSPISVHPDYFRQGIARAMMEKAATIAVELEYSSVFLCGDPHIYQGLGFHPSYSFNIYHKTDAQAEWCMGREFVKGSLDTISGMIDIV